MPIWSSPRGTAWIELGSETVLRFESDDEWIEAARRALRRTATLDAEVALPVLGDAIERPSDDASQPTLVVRFAPCRPRPSRTMSPGRACGLVVAMADLVAAHRGSGGDGVLGPYDPALIVETDGGDRMIAPGFVPFVQHHDLGIRGMRGGGRIAHHRKTYDLIRDTPGAPHEVTSLAVLAIELVSGREPYPTDSEFAYLTAVMKGAHAPLETLVPQLSDAVRATLERALRIDAEGRPTLDELKSALLTQPGARDHLVGRADAEPPPPRRPWWKLW